MTSGDLYWRVWISFVKWWLTQQAFPRSAIFTEIVSIEKSSANLTCSFFEGVVSDLSRSMSETSLVRISLIVVLADRMTLLLQYCLRSLLPLKFFLLVVLLDPKLLDH